MPKHQHHHHHHHNNNNDQQKSECFPVRFQSLHRLNHSFEAIREKNKSRVALLDYSSILCNPHFNKGTAFTDEERRDLHLEGLLPCSVESIQTQVDRCYLQIHRFNQPMSKYIYLNSLRERNETLFYRVLMDYLPEMLPYIYTPTVGQACVEYGLQFRMSEGMYISRNFKGRIREVLDNWRANIKDEVSIIVVTDGSRILGLGDLGASGMGIPIGKLSLYVAAAGFHPSTVLPVVIDVGTSNQRLLEDEFYLGQRHARLPEDEYYELIDEFMVSVKDKWPDVLVQFEDISNNHCFTLLEKYRHRQLCFNDDIQGTGAVIAAGYLNAIKVTKAEPRVSRIVMFGCGAAAVGVANQICRALEKVHGLTSEECRALFYMVDSKGLVTSRRGDKLADFKVPYSRTDVDENITNLAEIVKIVKPVGLIGLSGEAGAFNHDVIRLMGEINERPIIFPLSNPTDKSECSFKDAFELTEGRVVFASGSPFDPITLNEKVYEPSQGNNLYAFPGLGFGAWLCRAERVTDEMVTAATIALSSCVSESDLEAGRLYPCLSQVRRVSTVVAAHVIECAVQQGISQMASIPNNLSEFIVSNSYLPEYLEWPKKKL